MKDILMLPDSFLDWWFAPWIYAARSLPDMACATDRLGLRDGYRLWCEQAGIPPDLPEHFDAGWAVAAASSSEELIAAARLFAGLFAARQHDRTVLQALLPDERRWCAGIAAIQPLPGWHRTGFGADETVEMRGLFALARALQDAFPGMWPRLRLQLAWSMADRLDGLLASTDRDVKEVAPVSARMQRCWRLCRERAGNAALHMQPHPATERAGARIEARGDVALMT